MKRKKGEVQVTKSKRITELDYVRGFALLGILLTNIIAMYEFDNIADNKQANYLALIDFFVDNKFFSIFSFLFGIGFYIFIRNSKAKGLNSNLLFIRRMAILATFGILHQLLQPGEALLPYALFGLILLPFSYLNKYINLIAGVLLLLIAILIGDKFFLILPYFLLGLAVGKFELFSNIKIKTVKVLSLISGSIALICWYILYSLYVLPSYKLIDNSLSGQKLNNYIQSKELYDYMIVATSPFISLFYISFILLIGKTTIGNKILLLLQNYGRMALTNYVGQTIFIWLMISIFNRSQIQQSDTFWMCIIIYVIQLTIAYWWLKRFTYGPLEYLWRVGTYWSIKNIKNKNID